MKVRKQSLLLGVALVVLLAALVYIVVQSPLLMRGQVAGMKVGGGWSDYFFITSDQFNCVSDTAAGEIDCSASLEGRPLSASVTQTPGGTLLGCVASYAGETVPCHPAYSIFNTSRLGVYIDSDLGIRPERMAEIRSQRPLLYWFEDRWLTLAQVLAVAVTLVILARVWIFRTGKPASRVLLRVATSGAVVLFGGFLWISSLVGLIFLGYVD